MTRRRDHFGPPYSDAELVEELVADQAIEVTPDMEELAEYLADRLPAWQHDAVTERLATDADYRAWAAPLLALREARPRPVLDVTPNDLLRLERRLGQLHALRPPRTPDRDERQRFVRSLLVRFIFGAAALVALPILLIRNVPSLTTPDVREISTGTFNTPTGGAIVLATGARLSWQTRPDSNGAYHARIEGSAQVLQTLPASIRITTPAALIELRQGTLRLDGSTPGVTRVTLVNGSATVTPRGLPDAKAALMRSNTTMDVRYGAPLPTTNPDSLRRP